MRETAQIKFSIIYRLDYSCSRLRFIFVSAVPLIPGIGEYNVVTECSRLG